MALPQDGLRAALKGAGWRQGSVIAAADLAALAPKFVTADPAFQLPAAPVVLVCSQTCDLVNDTLAVEPVVDLVIGELHAEPDAPRQRNQHPRELDIELQRAGEPMNVRLYMRMRVMLAREHLLGLSPCAQTTLSAESLHTLVLWLRDRFSRTALPDEFVQRYKGEKGKNQKKLERVLKATPEIDQLFIGLDPFTEIGAGDVYRVVLLAVMRKDAAADVAKRERAVASLQKIRANLAACAGINVLDDVVSSEAQVSLADIREFKRFGFEYLSSDPEGGNHNAPELDNGPVL